MNICLSLSLSLCLFLDIHIHCVGMWKKKKHFSSCCCCWFFVFALMSTLYFLFLTYIIWLCVLKYMRECLLIFIFTYKRLYHYHKQYKYLFMFKTSIYIYIQHSKTNVIHRNAILKVAQNLCIYNYNYNLTTILYPITRFFLIRGKCYTQPFYIIILKQTNFDFHYYKY